MKLAGEGAVTQRLRPSTRCTATSADSTAADFGVIPVGRTPPRCHDQAAFAGFDTQLTTQDLRRSAGAHPSQPDGERSGEFEFDSESVLPRPIAGAVATRWLNTNLPHAGTRGRGVQCRSRFAPRLPGTLRRRCGGRSDGRTLQARHPRGQTSKARPSNATRATWLLGLLSQASVRAWPSLRSCLPPNMEAGAVYRNAHPVCQARRLDEQFRVADPRRWRCGSACSSSTSTVPGTMQNVIEGDGRIAQDRGLHVKVLGSLPKAVI